MLAFPVRFLLSWSVSASTETNLQWLHAPLDLTDPPLLVFFLAVVVVDSTQIGPEPTIDGGAAVAVAVAAVGDAVVSGEAVRDARKFQMNQTEQMKKTKTCAETARHW